jgi:pyruvate dehydrogenase E2 component (dihydrolipoamide acetyltransferase)
MTIKEIRIPDIGGSTDVEVIELNVAVGDQVNVDDPLIVLESDKASMEVPSPAAGNINELCVAVGDKVSEGDLIVLMDIEESVADSASDQIIETTKLAAKQSETTEDESISSSKEGTVYIEQVKVPDLGGAESVPIIEIMAKINDQLLEDEGILVLESDKASMEIPSPKPGKLVTLAVKVGDKVSEGDLIGEIEIQVSGSTNKAVPSPGNESKVKTSTEIADPKKVPETSMPVSIPNENVNNLGRVHAGPSVRKLARELGADLSKVQASGPRGRILKEDLQAYIKQQVKQAQSGGTASGMGVPVIKLPDFSQFGQVTRRAMSRIHQLTAQNMHASWLNVPHVTQFDEADITELEAFRKSQKELAKGKGVPLTPLPFLLKACAYALTKLPQFNVSVDFNTQEVIEKHYINIGVAVDTPSGLMVPVIKNVDTKSLWTLAEETVQLANKAKEKKLMPVEMQGGCFTISSLGSIGGTAFTPIVNTPEVAILGISKASIKPVYLNNTFEPRLMLPLSLSYDHRAVNGADAARFTTLLGVLLGDIRQMLL